VFPDAFLANMALHADFAKAAKFLALIYQPAGLQSGGLFGGLIGGANSILGSEKIGKGINTAGLSLQCESAVLPGYQINTVEQKIFGAPLQMAATPVYEPLTLSFICAGDMWERKFFDDWMDFILPKSSLRETSVNFFTIDNHKTSGAEAKYRDEYIGTIQVIQFHDTGIPIARFTFEEAFPVALSAQPVNWGDDQIHRLSVTFSYRVWSREENILKQVYEQFKQHALVGTPPVGTDLPFGIDPNTIPNEFFR
jgi:hypothetical protein